MSQQGAGALEALLDVLDLAEPIGDVLNLADLEEQEPVGDVLDPEEQEPVGDVLDPEEPIGDELNPVVEPQEQRIEIEREYGVNLVELVRKPLAQWAARYGPVGPLVQPRPADLSPDDLSNGFEVKLVFRNLLFVPEGATSIQVRGRETIERVCGKVFRALELSERWDHGRNYAVFFRTKDTKLYIPAGTLIAQVLTSDPSENAVGITLECLLAEPNPQHGVFGIIPAAEVA